MIWYSHGGQDHNPGDLDGNKKDHNPGDLNGNKKRFGSSLGHITAIFDLNVFFLLIASLLAKYFTIRFTHSHSQI